MIELVHLRKEYELGTPLEDVNAVINDGDIISVIGPSGTGKSVTLKHLVRLLTPTSGRVLVDGGLYQNGQPTEALKRLSQAENDFTPLLVGSDSLPDMANARSALLSAHMPGLYGAWMTVALK